MAHITYATVYAGAGFAGESFDICSGHDVDYDTTAGDAVFAAAGKTITLTAGTWPVWIREVGKEFAITGTTSNDGTYHVVSVDGTFKILTVVETLVNETPAGVTNFDGAINTGIIDVLLKTGNGVLTVDSPWDLISTGALGGARTLDIASLESETTDQGGMPLPGRPIFLHILNSDISASNSITISSSTPGTINGNASFVITSQGDYMLMHVANGLWRVCLLPRPSEGLAAYRRVAFLASDWNAGATKNKITIIQTGSPTAGQVGPHTLPIYEGYNVDIINTDIDGTDSTSEMVKPEIKFDAATGNIILLKAEKAKPFNGYALIVGFMD